TGGGQGLPVVSDGRLPVRGAGLRRAPLQAGTTALARLAVRGLLEKLGIDWEKAKAEFEVYLKEVAAGRVETLYDPKRAITSGPGYEKPVQPAQIEVNS
ncbi:protein of unknown function cysteine-rich region domain protein, partial [mine drainage metagenome]